MAPMRQADGRTGAACACEAEARWDPKRKQSRHGRRRLVGHVGPETGEVVTDEANRGVGPVALCDSLARRHGEGDRLSCDTTSASSRSEALAQVRRGRNKGRVPLPQTSLAMPVGHGSGMPPCCRRVAGNVADAGTARTPMRDTGPPSPAGFAW
mgnify:CR=1 FL=1